MLAGLLMCSCSTKDYETAMKRWHKDSQRSILRHDLLSGCGELVFFVSHSSGLQCTCAIVKVALDSQSEVLTQLKAALAVELVDYFIQSNWSPKKQIEVLFSSFSHKSNNAVISGFPLCLGSLKIAETKR